MIPPEVRDGREEIDRFTNGCLEAEIILDLNPIVVTRKDDGYIVSWATSLSGEAILYDIPSLSEYLRLTEERQYSLLLRDYSLLQFSYNFGKRGDLEKHRLCYYPCPLSLASDELVEGWGLLDYVDALTDAELRTRIRCESPIRFDYDSRAARPGHPAAHLTISRSCCRVPIFAPVSLGHFVRFIFDNFYPEWWDRHRFIRDWPIRWGDRTIQDEECLKIFMECRRSA